MMPGIPKFRKESHPERAGLKGPGTGEDQFFHIFSRVTHMS